MTSNEIIGILIGASSGSSAVTLVISHFLSKKERETKIQKLVTETYESTYAFMNQQITQLREDVATLSNTVSTYRKQEIEWAEKRRTLINRIKQLEKLNDNLNEQLKTLSAANKNYAKVQNEMHEEIEQLKKQIKQLKP